MTVTTDHATMPAIATLVDPEIDATGNRVYTLKPLSNETAAVQVTIRCSADAPLEVDSGLLLIARRYGRKVLQRTPEGFGFPTSLQASMSVWVGDIEYDISITIVPSNKVSVHGIDKDDATHMLLHCLLSIHIALQKTSCREGAIRALCNMTGESRDTIVSILDSPLKMTIKTVHLTVLRKLRQLRSTRTTFTPASMGKLLAYRPRDLRRNFQR